MATAPDIYGALATAAETGVRIRTPVKLKAGVSVGMGFLIGTVAGLGVLPTAANAGTWKCAGVSVDNKDNSAGADNDLTVIAEDGVRDFKNSGSNPVTNAHRGLTVYAADYETISFDSADGPPVGKMIELAPDGYMPGRPVRVRLAVG